MKFGKVVIAGASGATGFALVHELLQQDCCEEIVCTSRHGKIKDFEGLEKVKVIKVDAICDNKGLIAACEDADVLFCCIGLPQYEGKVWQKEWPKITENLLEACEACGSVLVFMDNMYCFGPEGMNRMPLRESDTTYSQVKSKIKPQVRVAMTRKLLEAHEQGRCKLVLVRSSDFYGPRVLTSLGGFIFNTMLVENGRPMVFGNPNCLHTQVYIKDVARALVMVSKTPETYGKALHVPSEKTISTVDFIKMIADANGKTNPGYFALRGPISWLLSLCLTQVREIREMGFMWEHDFVVDSSEFSKFFPDFQPTPLELAIQETSHWFANKDK